MFEENKKAVPAQRSHRTTAVDRDALDSFLKNSIDRTSVDVWNHSLSLPLRSRKSVFGAASVVEHREVYEEVGIERRLAPDHIRRA